jgi:hypothetical protein
MPKFLKTLDDLRAQLAAMGRARKAGESIDEKKYKKLSQWLKNARTAERHAEWIRLYDSVYAEKCDQYLADGMEPSRAKKRAHGHAKAEVMDVFDKTEQNVMREIIPYE